MNGHTTHRGAYRRAKRTKHVAQATGSLTHRIIFYFTCSYWDGPAQQPSDAAIRINKARHIHVESCNFVASLGGYGVAIGNASASCSVTGCLFDHPGQGGVIAFGYDKGVTPTCHGCAPNGVRSWPFLSLFLSPQSRLRMDGSVITCSANILPSCDVQVSIYSSVCMTQFTLPPIYINISTRLTDNLSTNATSNTHSPSRRQYTHGNNKRYWNKPTTSATTAITVAGWLQTSQQPTGVTVSYCVAQDIGQQLVHVAAVALRVASDSLVAHNRV